MARILRIDGSETRSDLVEAIGRLRAKQRACEDAGVAAEIGAEVDELVALVVARGQLPDDAIAR